MSKEYQRLLNLYFKGNTEACIDGLCAVIEAKKDHPELFPLYRLWIEILAEKGDLQSLHELAQHLLYRGSVSPWFAVWQSIRGICHLELDEIEAAHLIAMGLKNAPPEAYAIDFLARYALRLASPNRKVKTSFKELHQDPVDYFHYRTRLEVGVHNQSTKEQNQIFNILSQLFPTAPLAAQFAGHQAIEEKRYKDAKENFASLYKQNPKRLDYAFYFSYALMQNQEYEQAITTLEQAYPKAKDADVLNILAFCHEAKATDVAHPSWQEAKKFRQQAMAAYGKLGLPTSELELRQHQKQAVENKANSTEVKPLRIIETWFFHLSQADKHEFLTAKPSEVEVLYQPLGKSVCENDLVFFAGFDHMQKESIRLYGLYSAQSNPVFHPVNGWETPLLLIERFTAPINIAVKNPKKKKHTESPQYPKGVYKLDNSALELVKETIGAMNRGVASHLNKQAYKTS